MSAAEIDRSNELLERSQVAKICGADVELGNFVLGTDARGSAPEDAASALLREIDGIPNRACLTPLRMGGERVGSLYLPGYVGGADRPGNILVPAVDAQDYGRKFLTTNGGCVYIDLNHLEICLPEVRSAWDHLACWHAMLRTVRAAQRVANAKLETGKIQVLVNNSDGQDSSYGSHLDFLITRRAWDNMFTRKLHPLLFLAAYQASSIVFAGQGKVGSENAAPEVGFQLSQRADFIETLVGSQTTFRRPLVNSRDEPLCGAGGAGRDALARLHVICYDSTLSHVAHVLKVGVMQIILAMIEAEVTNPLLALDDSVAAIRRWSHDATLQHRERLTADKTVTAVELQRLFIEEARPFVRDGGCEGVVPRAAEILELWDDTVARLERSDFETLSRRLDWVLKLSILRSVAESRELSWKSPEMKHLDHLFASLDPDDGLFWSYERGGFVERLVSEAEIQQSAREPPADTRAWARTMLLRAAGPDRVSEVDWDCVRIRTAAHGWAMTRPVDLPDPRAHTQQSSGSLFDVDGLVTEIADSANEFEQLH